MKYAKEMTTMVCSVLISYDKHSLNQVMENPFTNGKTK